MVFTELRILSKEAALSQPVLKDNILSEMVNACLVHFMRQQFQVNFPVKNLNVDQERNYPKRVNVSHVLNI